MFAVYAGGLCQIDEHLRLDNVIVCKFSVTFWSDLTAIRSWAVIIR